VMKLCLSLFSNQILTQTSLKKIPTQTID